MTRLKAGTWLGIDVGSARKKVCSFCLIESDGAGKLGVSFENGPADNSYPDTNTEASLIDRSRPPTYLKEKVETAILGVLDHSELVGRWLGQSRDQPSALAIDAPVALASNGEIRLTEMASTDSITTPGRETFEANLRDKEDPFLRINAFWKCVGFAVYRNMAARLEPTLDVVESETIAAWTCERHKSSRRIRETFPSDVYKRANGRVGTLSPEARHVLHSVVVSQVEWRGAGQEKSRPAPSTLRRLRTIRDFLSLDSEAGADRLCEMRRHPGRYGDLWDAFTCAFTCCCEDHDGAELHGWSDDRSEQKRLRREGAILTVTRNGDSGSSSTA